ncbi:MAG: regulatory protein GemA, partial [Xanthomonadales bacterium]|nr:regulatory protein GemA [Xanthomonadales bacterium]
ILLRIAGVTSSTALDDNGLGNVLDELRRLAGESPRAYPGKPHNFYSSQAMPETITKIEAQLADMGLTWSYADAIARRMFGLERVAWVRDTPKLAAIVAALYVEQEKRALLASVEQLREQLGVSGHDWEEITAQLRKGWQRNRKALGWLENYLIERRDHAHHEREQVNAE